MPGFRIDEQLLDQVTTYLPNICLAEEMTLTHDEVYEINDHLKIARDALQVVRLGLETAAVRHRSR